VGTGRAVASASPERQAWLAERRAAVVADYDAEAASFDDHPYPAHSHASFVLRLLETCPTGGTVLDAPCGTGRYFELVRASGREVVGVDQSAGMLAQAQRRGLATRLEHIGLQELPFEAAFDGAITIDAMENISPEDWPVVLANLHRAVRPGGHLYMTVEETEQTAIEAALVDAQARGLPAVLGEVTEGDVAGYHYYPSRTQVATWLAAEGLDLVAEAFDQEDGWAYRHLLLKDGAMRHRFVTAEG
jgi:ubiquinone/menaquinone biosynthesis C-methylase UbiE